MKEYLFTDNQEPVVLNDYMRGLLLTEICRRMDVARFFMYTLRIPVEFTRTKGTGPCPWCGAAGAFTVHKKTGRCRCSQCGRSDDLLALFNEKENSELHGTLSILTGYLQSAEKNRRQERQAPHA